MNTNTDCKRKDKETREEIEVILSSFDSYEARLYWLNVLVKEGRVSECRAGQILTGKLRKA